MIAATVAIVATARRAASAPERVDNRVAIAGQVASAPQLRLTPAGIPITRFLLRHASQRPQDGASREVRCEIEVVASGALAHGAQALREGDSIHVTGFLARASYRSNARWLVLHAEHLAAHGNDPAPP